MKIEIVPAEPRKAFGTIVRDAETKQNIEGVKSVTWTHRVGEVPTVTLEIYCHVVAPVPPLNSESVKVVDVTPLESDFRKFAVTETPA